ncbi:MAG: efflux RND transporter periplasmic adaptor subunit [Planctomycetes bacterium]|nr:efflux RND transporter periplasmic adaptor subunit [Planctomycetota bacterium]
MAGGRTVEVVHPARQDVVRRIRLPGSVEPWEQATIYARATGYLREIRVDRGDAVRAGDVLAVLDIPEMVGEMEKARAEARASEAETVLQATVAGNLEAAQALDAGAVGRQDLDVARARAQAAAARRDAALAAVARLDALAALFEVRAPFDGRVAERGVSPGALVTAGSTPIARLVQADRLRVVVDLPDTEVRHLRLGNPARVSIVALGTASDGRVGRVAARLDAATRTQRIEIDLENPEGRITPGLYADVTLDLETRPQSLVVPASAVLAEKRRKSVMVLVPAGGGYTVRKQEIRTGVDDGILAEILEGLSGGEILAAYPGTVSDGESVAEIREKR